MAQLGNCENQWAALSADRSRVVSCDESLERAIEKAIELGEAKPVLIKVPSKDGSYIF